MKIAKFSLHERMTYKCTARMCQTLGAKVLSISDDTFLIVITPPVRNPDFSFHPSTISSDSFLISVDSNDSDTLPSDRTGRMRSPGASRSHPEKGSLQQNYSDTRLRFALFMLSA